MTDDLKVKLLFKIPEEQLCRSSYHSREEKKHDNIILLRCSLTGWLLCVDFKPAKAGFRVAEGERKRAGRRRGEDEGEHVRAVRFLPKALPPYTHLPHLPTRL
ncbi:hypothetical protein AMECASPLE_037978 [Ameca splendens]|uniref:Uncharacterized protein n=1 Tax=Ameca splendens TaxID=208324 RepID=A0ABV0YV46_9TELE